MDIATPAAAPGESPGQAIRAARERARLSLDDLATQIKLSRATLEALEKDDFASLLEPVYVRGYYRKCAKVLGLPEKQLIDAYNALVRPSAPQLPTKVRLAPGDDVGGRSLPTSFFVVPIVIALIAGGVWYLRQSRQPSADVPATLGLETAPVSGDAPAALSVETPASDVRDINVSPATAPITGPASAPGAPEPEPASAAATSPAAATDAAVPASGADVLVLNFVSTSWARVQDASKRTLLNRVVQSGERQTLGGTPPYSVFLGNAPGVKVEFRGKALDIAAVVKDNATARFSVPLSATPADAAAQ